MIATMSGKLQRRLPKFNQFSQNGVFGRDNIPHKRLSSSQSNTVTNAMYHAKRTKSEHSHQAAYPVIAAAPRVGLLATANRDA